MKRTFIKLSLCAIVASLAIVSCSKSSSPSTTSKLIGTWKIHEEVLDTNNNGKMDLTGDLVAVVDSENLTLVFNSNGTGLSPAGGSGTANPFTWKVSGNYVVLTDTSAGSVPSGLLITAGPSTTLTLEDTSSHPIAWYILNKE